jgi:serine/threonine-protein kinase
MVERGSILGEKYLVGRTLGSGGMGIIVEATHLQLGTQVAVKVLRAKVTEKPDAAERFLREARAAAQLRNEHICRVHDYGTLDNGAPFMVMELLEGRDLGTLVDQQGPLPVDLVAHCIVQTCTGIAEPHSRGMIHRDIKPANLFLVQTVDDSLSIKILDFGIAKFESIDFKLTETTNVVGSPAYMAPEQLKSSKAVDTRTDIWALGVVMYELLTEKQPFTGDTMTELALAISTEPPLPLPDTIPAEFAAIVMKCLEKDPANRYQDVAELAEALAPFADLDDKAAGRAARMLARPSDAMAVVDELFANQTGIGKANGAAAKPAAADEPQTGLTGVVITKPLPRATLGLAAALVVALVVIVWLYMRHDDSAAAPPPVVPDAQRVVATPDAAAVKAATPDAAPPPDAAEPDAAPPPDAAPVDVPPKKHGGHHTTTTPDKHHTTPPPGGDLGKSRF